MSFGKKCGLAVKCIRYGSNLKMNLICIGLFFVLGLVYDITDLANGMGSALLLVTSLYPAQLLYSVCGSQLVQTSPYKKALMTSIPTVLTMCSGILMYLLVVVIEAARTAIRPETAEQGIFTVLMAGVILMLMDIYAGIVYKYFWISVVLMCGGVIGISAYVAYIKFSIRFVGHSPQLFAECPLPAAAVIGLCFALLGSLLQYGVSLLVYKKPISKRAVYGLMRRQV